MLRKASAAEVFSLSLSLLLSFAGMVLDAAGSHFYSQYETCLRPPGEYWGVADSDITLKLFKCSLGAYSSSSCICTSSSSSSGDCHGYMTVTIHPSPHHHHRISHERVLTTLSLA